MPEPDIHATELTEEAILNHVKQLAQEELELPPQVAAQIQLETSLGEGLNLDSLAQTILMAQVGDRYGFEFEVEDREQLQAAETVRDLARIILLRAHEQDE